MFTDKFHFNPSHIMDMSKPAHYILSSNCSLARAFTGRIYKVGMLMKDQII